ncbi:hypothetical protein RZC90_006186 [Pseudomonas aeruginosa]|uniref:hypothetical protein n=1 Tax=Pseudomonas aeruginosa TaxID=287 RepID=UPI00249B124B|nr:hypothetical protein [Pseudomonas aeruginosa]EIU1455994.1 hypothetical protein [Pseudomonas aeruginosa]EIU5317867.1 hypothetical protein [Pseudomonas aeruginosa]EIU5484257.1 hypothetical protein [Pseudomonas aeruginosa]EIW4043731.1 hypothetical protein [Pseudomonas aeruginosa]EIX1825058.1 hypothetical protein [Pseudomonas aeruginosa]
MSNCSHEAWDFGALQCPDCGAVKGHVADADYAKLEAEAQALREEVARLLEDRARFPDKPDDIGRMIGAHIEDLKHVADESRRMCLKAMRERDVVEQDLEALRAGVVVVPERRQWGGLLPTAENLKTDGFNACLDELARLNGMTVSEGLLRRIVTPALTSSDAQDRIGALEELRALLSEQEGGKQ